ncbi:MAG: glycogen/starch/alpha-glucan phosphorylase [Leptospirales bacterium]|nr:glycogen/starch/alpha-glucan phosphorylase [Leptospirales bacterium]
MKDRYISTKERNTPITNEALKLDSETLKTNFIDHMEFSLAKDEYTATARDQYTSLALTVRDRLTERLIETKNEYYNQDPKRVYYLSLEFLMGRTLGNTLINLDLHDNALKAMTELGYNMEELSEIEFDAGLGNGGLGRLASCFMDSLATLGLPSVGYGLRYDYGIFFQSIVNGYQVETPDNWLRFGNIWEFQRPELTYIVHFYGKIESQNDNGKLKTKWVDTHDVIALAFDTPIPGYRNNTVNNLRLWSAKSTRELDLNYFNDGDYMKAVEAKASSENITKVLYPNDNTSIGKELRIKQEYLFVSATIQDIIRRYKIRHSDMERFADFSAIQLNDTHPALAIPELMRILVDIEDLSWDNAWNVTINTFAYTNHTILPEALEKWSVSLMEKILPRHMQIIYEINRRFIDMLNAASFDNSLIKDLSIIEEGPEKKVRMANLAIIGSSSINGVAALHSNLIKTKIFAGFYKLWPHKFNNKTNGITQRRWLKLCNPKLSELISEKIGDGWTTDLFELAKLKEFADNEDFQNRWMEIKANNKERLAKYILNRTGVIVNTSSMFDIQVKRLHEYKRQLLNALSVITMYNRIKQNPGGNFVPRTVIFAGKAAPGYYMAKLIIKLINSIAEAVNDDKAMNGLLNVLFLRNYAVSNAEKIIPAADLSQQISTAGTEASGTGNMKFALNGALTIGTFDGANIEIIEEVGEENFFCFGLKADEVEALRNAGYNPMHYYNANQDLQTAISQINDGFFSGGDTELFKPITDSLLYHGDNYMLFADYESYITCQETVSQAFTDKRQWAKMSILNTAGMGKFSTDRTISEYANEIWKIKPVKVNPPGSN